MSTRKKYNKSVKINYQQVNSLEAIKAVDTFFDGIFDKLYKGKNVADVPNVVEQNSKKEKEAEVQWYQFQPLELTFTYNTL